jgi:hypothetical protein
MKKVIITSLVFICLISLSNAQDYKTGVGLRVGFYNGLTVKHFISRKSALEAQLASRWKGFDITGLYELHDQAFSTERLKWFIGFGGHMGFWNGDNTTWGNADTNYTVIGVDGILGIEFSLREIPLNIGLDWKPVYNFSGYSGFWYDGGAFSIRYIF